MLFRSYDKVKNVNTISAKTISLSDIKWAFTHLIVISIIKSSEAQPKYKSRCGYQQKRKGK